MCVAPPHGYRPRVSKDQQVTRTRTRQHDTRQQNKPLTRTQNRESNRILMNAG